MRQANPKGTLIDGRCVQWISECRPSAAEQLSDLTGKFIVWMGFLSQAKREKMGIKKDGFVLKEASGKMVGLGRSTNDAIEALQAQRLAVQMEVFKGGLGEWMRQYPRLLDRNLEKIGGILTPSEIREGVELLGYRNERDLERDVLRIAKTLPRWVKEGAYVEQRAKREAPVVAREAVSVTQSVVPRTIAKPSGDYPHVIANAVIRSLRDKAKEMRRYALALLDESPSAAYMRRIFSDSAKMYDAAANGSTENQLHDLYSGLERSFITFAEDTYENKENLTEYKYPWTRTSWKEALPTPQQAMDLFSDQVPTPYKIQKFIEEQDKRMGGALSLEKRRAQEVERLRVHQETERYVNKLLDHWRLSPKEREGLSTIDERGKLRKEATTRIKEYAERDNFDTPISTIGDRIKNRMATEGFIVSKGKEAQVEKARVSSLSSRTLEQSLPLSQEERDAHEKRERELLRRSMAGEEQEARNEFRKEALKKKYWKNAVIEISPTQGGEESVDAIIFDGLAVHKVLKGSGYGVTHLNSGMSLSGQRFNKSADAKVWAFRLAHMADWSQSAEAGMRDFTRVMKVMGGMKDHVDLALSPGDLEDIYGSRKSNPCACDRTPNSSDDTAIISSTYSMGGEEFTGREILDANDDSERDYILDALRIAYTNGVFSDLHAEDILLVSRSRTSNPSVDLSLTLPASGGKTQVYFGNFNTDTGSIGFSVPTGSPQYADPKMGIALSKDDIVRLWESTQLVEAVASLLTSEQLRECHALIRSGVDRSKFTASDARKIREILKDAEEEAVEKVLATVAPPPKITVAPQVFPGTPGKTDLFGAPLAEQIDTTTCTDFELLRAWCQLNAWVERDGKASRKFAYYDRDAEEERLAEAIDSRYQDAEFRFYRTKQIPVGSLLPKKQRGVAGINFSVDPVIDEYLPVGSIIRTGEQMDLPLDQVKRCYVKTHGYDHRGHVGEWTEVYPGVGGYDKGDTVPLSECIGDDPILYRKGMNEVLRCGYDDTAELNRIDKELFKKKAKKEVEIVVDAPVAVSPSRQKEVDSRLYNYVIDNYRSFAIDWLKTKGEKFYLTDAQLKKDVASLKRRGFDADEVFDDSLSSVLPPGTWAAHPEWVRSPNPYKEGLTLKAYRCAEDICFIPNTDRTLKPEIKRFVDELSTFMSEKIVLGWVEAAVLELWMRHVMPEKYLPPAPRRGETYVEQELKDVIGLMASAWTPILQLKSIAYQADQRMPPMMRDLFARRSKKFNKKYGDDAGSSNYMAGSFQEYLEGMMYTVFNERIVKWHTVLKGLDAKPTMYTRSLLYAEAVNHLNTLAVRLFTAIKDYSDTDLFNQLASMNSADRTYPEYLDALDLLWISAQEKGIGADTFWRLVSDFGPTFSGEGRLYIRVEDRGNYDSDYKKMIKELDEDGLLPSDIAEKKAGHTKEQKDDFERREAQRKKEALTIWPELEAIKGTGLETLNIGTLKNALTRYPDYKVEYDRNGIELTSPSGSRQFVNFKDTKDETIRALIEKVWETAGRPAPASSVPEEAGKLVIDTVRQMIPESMMDALITESPSNFSDIVGLLMKESKAPYEAKPYIEERLIEHIKKHPMLDQYHPSWDIREDSIFRRSHSTQQGAEILRYFSLESNNDPKYKEFAKNIDASLNAMSWANKTKMRIYAYSDMGELRIRAKDLDMPGEVPIGTFMLKEDDPPETLYKKATSLFQKAIDAEVNKTRSDVQKRQEEAYLSTGSQSDMAKDRYRRESAKIAEDVAEKKREELAQQPKPVIDFSSIAAQIASSLKESGALERAAKASREG